MGVTVATVQFAANTSDGTQDITTTDLGGLTPEAAVFTYGTSVSNGTSVNGVQWGMGVTDGSQSFAVCVNDDHGVTTTDTAKRATED